MSINKNYPLKNLKKITDEIEDVAKKAGEKLIRYQKKLSSLTITAKKAQGVVSEADVNVENYIVRELKKVVPDAQFLAEESSYGESSWETYKKSELLWVIDPLDGTTNFLSNMDYYAVCISLCYQGEPIIGVVHRPRTDETYRAYIGGGSFKRHGHGRLKKNVCSQDKNKKLKQCLLATGFATEKGAPFDQEFRYFKTIMGHCRGVRRMGSAAMDLCLLAEGTFDGFWERGLSPWDVAAAGLICSEAGFRLSDYSNKKYSPFNETIVAARPSIHKSLIKLLA